LKYEGHLNESSLGPVLGKGVVPAGSEVPAAPLELLELLLKPLHHYGLNAFINLNLQTGFISTTLNVCVKKW
jgi:hypothetical protein